ncbi:MAG: YdgA family protein [Candidatus Dadabacteria bacterium]|nr:YdgA family protein [Candidatus Dadabacteria bacterium]
MRVIIGIIVVLVLGLLGATYWFGMGVEKKYTVMIESANNIGRLEVKQKSYDRGFLSSAAEVEYSVKSRSGKAGFRVISKDEIVHGPIGLANMIKGKFSFNLNQALIENTLTLTATSDEGFNKILKQLPPVKLNSVVAMSGDFVSTLSLTPFKKTFKENEITVDFKGIKGKFSSNAQLTKGKGALKMPLLDISGEDANLNFTNLAFDYDVDKGKDGLGPPLGSASFSMSKFHILTDDGKDFNLDDLIFKSHVVEKKGNIEFKLDVKLNEISLDETVYGPGSFVLAIRNIDSKTWIKIKKEMDKLDKKKISDYERSKMTNSTIMKMLPDLLKNSPEIELTELSFKTSEGEMSGWAKIYLSDSSPETLKNLFLLIGAINAELKFSMPALDLEKILEDMERDKILENYEAEGRTPPMEVELQILAKEAVAERMQQFVEQGMFRVKNDHYTIEVAYKGGQLTVNGEDKPIPMVGF